MCVVFYLDHYYYYFHFFLYLHRKTKWVVVFTNKCNIVHNYKCNETNLYTAKRHITHTKKKKGYETLHKTITKKTLYIKLVKENKEKKPDILCVGC